MWIKTQPVVVKEFRWNCSRIVLNIYDHTVAVSDQKRLETIWQCCKVQWKQIIMQHMSSSKSPLAKEERLDLSTVIDEALCHFIINNYGRANLFPIVMSVCVYLLFWYVLNKKCCHCRQSFCTTHAQCLILSYFFVVKKFFVMWCMEQSRGWLFDWCNFHSTLCLFCSTLHSRNNKLQWLLRY